MTPQLLAVSGPSGAAFALRKPASESVEVDRAEGTVVVRAGAPYVTVVLRTATHNSGLRDTAWRVLQEGLDIHAAATHHQALATVRGEQEYILWSKLGDAYSLTIFGALDCKWDQSIRLTAGTGQDSQPPPDPIPHHPALRFYRLSRLSADLFDAFRNAYLALECLVSCVSAKRRSEAELDWLIRVLTMDLSQDILHGIDVVRTARQIYRLGRLPLFHAKTDQTFYLPQGEERAEVQATLATLQLLISSILNARVSNRLPGGWGQKSRALIDIGATAILKSDEFIYRLDSEHESAYGVLEVVKEPRRFGTFWARTSIAPPRSLTAIDAISFLLEGTEMFGMKLEEALSLERVGTVQLEVGVLDSNVRAPRPLHPA